MWVTHRHGCSARPTTSAFDGSPRNVSLCWLWRVTLDRDLMRKLARRSALSIKFGLRYVDGEWPYLDIEHPVGVARLVGEAKRNGKSDRVFIRGQVRHHHAMLPSLL